MASKQTSVKKILCEARALVADHKTWTKNTFARTASGKMTRSDAPNAVRFCALGALRKVGDSYTFQQEAEHLLQNTTRRLFHQSVPNVNDGPNGRKKMLEAFDAAIETLP